MSRSEPGRRSAARVVRRRGRRRHGTGPPRHAELVATIEIDRPPHNYFDVSLMRRLADALDALADLSPGPSCLCSVGRNSRRLSEKISREIVGLVLGSLQATPRLPDEQDA